jgi:hypothetical protein
MKKLFIIMALFTGLIACKNKENIFPDYQYTTGYFPYQYPVRTLVLGDYIYDNSNDNNHKFLISVALGGVYANNKDRVFDIVIDNKLCDSVLFTSSLDTIRIMPSNYYSLSSTSKITIPKGQVNGSIEVQLTDAFFNDPKSIKLGYVIPVRLVASKDVDSILQGSINKSNPDSRIASNWSIVPKNFTMFAVKYINPYHGKYLHRGKSIVKNTTNTVIDSAIYHQPYNVNDEIWSMITTAKNQVSVVGGIKSKILTGSLNMLLTFLDNGDCTVSQNVGSAFTITGTGKFVKDADEWGNEKRDAIFLKYQLTSGTNTYSATDTLVIRDRAVVMELYTPKVIKKIQ